LNAQESKMERGSVISDKERQKIGFIGFGEVGRALSQRMKGMGGEIVVYDKFPDRVKERAEELKIPLIEQMVELIHSCSLLLSTLWPDAALESAKETAPFLSTGQIYCDLNSISPETTEEIQKVISPSGADFVKIGIMAGIPDRGFAVPLIAGGKKAKEVEEILSSLGLSIQAISLDPKHPAAIKILRSVCLKGLVAVTYEMLRGAERYGVSDQILESASEVMSKASFKDTLNNWLASTAIHARRRAKEMEEAIETLENAGIDPVMSIGTKKIFEEIASFQLDEIFKGQIPDSFHEVLEKIAKNTSSSRED
jgi:3-hydroxyisobutyrate dehydrogenase-like beta-hydroxyacid dehydrogenase